MAQPLFFAPNQRKNIWFAPLTLGSGAVFDLFLRRSSGEIYAYRHKASWWTGTRYD